MDESSLQRALREDPEDDAARLAYADWLGTNGQEDRAAWIRASCEFAPLSFTDPRWNPVGDQVRHFWNRCRPKWWEELTGVIASKATNDWNAAHGPTTQISCGLPGRQD